MTLAAGSFRDRDCHDVIFDADLRCDLAAEPPLASLPGFGGSVPLSMPLGLMVGRPFRPFSRAISSRCSAAVFPGGDFAEQFNQQSLKLCTA